MSKSATEFAHTINGTAVAIPRLIISLLETHQERDGSRIWIPTKLRPYFKGPRVEWIEL